jgi:hypothetical protein
MHWWSRGVAPHILNLVTRRKWVVSFTPRPLYSRGRTPVLILKEAGCAPESVWTRWRRENSQSPPVIEPRSSYRPARSQSLCWLRYPGSCNWLVTWLHTLYREDCYATKVCMLCLGLEWRRQEMHTEFVCGNLLRYARERDRRITLRWILGS